MTEDLIDDNKRVTDHLANERTYLAWIRTGVSMLGLGVVIAKLRYILGANYPESSGIVHAAHIGWWFAVIGVITILLSLFFFLQTQADIRRARYRSRKSFALILAILTGCLGVAILWYLAQPTAPADESRAGLTDQLRYKP